MKLKFVVLKMGSDTRPCFSFYIPSKEPPFPSQFYCINNMEEGSDNQVASGKKKTRIGLGPWGGNGGTSWDDGIYNGIGEITLVYGKCIDSITVEYYKNGKLVPAVKHGGVGGNQTAQIKLQYPYEYLIGVSGNYSPVVHGGSPVIRCLTFKSNHRSYGPYGVVEGTPFTFAVDGCQIVGFKGRSGWYLDSIGFHLKPVSTNFVRSFHRRLQKLTNTFAPSSTRNTNTGEATLATAGEKNI